MRAYNLVHFFFCTFGAFWPYLKKYLITLKSQFFTPNSMLHMTKNLWIYYFNQKNIFGQNLTSNAVFTIRIPEKNAFFRFCHRFQEIFIMPHFAKIG